MPIASLVDARYTARVPDAFLLRYYTGTAIGELILDSRDLTLDEQFTTLITQGTTVTHEKDTLDVFRVNLTNAVYQKALSRVALMDPTTTGITGVAERTGYDGSYRSERLSLRIRMKATNLTTGQDAIFQYTFWSLQTKQYRGLAGATAKQVAEQTIQFVATQAKVDLDGSAIPGLKNTLVGDIFSEDLMTA